MASAFSATPVERVRRVDLFAYVFGLLGLSFVTESVTAGGGSGSTLASVGAALVGAFAVLGALHVRRHPENVRRGTEPAPLFLYALATVATIAFFAVTAIRFGLV